MPRVPWVRPSQGSLTYAACGICPRARSSRAAASPPPRRAPGTGTRAAPNHALAPELSLKPVLVELGAICPAPGLYLIDNNYAEDPALESWIERARPLVQAIAS